MVNPGKFAGSLAKNILGTRNTKRLNFDKRPKPNYPTAGKILGTAALAAKKTMGK